jgi:chorismate--pyruvate lyase
MRDLYWQSLMLGSASYAPWLRDHGSLTRRIQQRCEKFTVHPLFSGLDKVAFDEAKTLGFAHHRLAFSREVFLYADGKPVVFAHSACAQRDSRGAWQAIRGLGNQSLGTLLFTHPLVKRQPLHYKKLHPQYPLYRSACALSNGTVLPRSHGEREQNGRAPDFLWARRSLFYLNEAPLLVTEVFLPEILQLDK